MGAVPAAEQPAPPAAGDGRGRAHRADRGPTRPAGGRGRRTRRLRELDATHVRFRHRRRLHAAVQRKGLGPSGRDDERALDGGAGEHGRVAPGRALRGAPGRRRGMGAQQPVLVPPPGWHRRDLPAGRDRRPGSSPPRRGRARRRARRTSSGAHRPRHDRFRSPGVDRRARPPGGPDHLAGARRGAGGGGSAGPQPRHRGRDRVRDAAGRRPVVVVLPGGRRPVLPPRATCPAAAPIDTPAG